MLIVFALVVILGLYGAINGEIGWWEAAAYFAIVVASFAVTVLLLLPAAFAIVPGVICGIILLFRCDLANVRNR
jgi:hypothetical protein